VFAGFGSQFVSIAMLFFTFSTIMAYYFYAESSILFLFKGRRFSSREKLCVRVLQVVLIAAIVFGAVKEADLVWMLGDIGVGLMAWVTVITILILCPKALDALKDYEQGLKIKK